MPTQGLKPEKLDLESSDPEASKKYKHWLRCFKSFCAAQEDPSKINKLEYLISLVSHNIYEIVEECETYEAAVKILDASFIKKSNLLFSRHSLITRKQKDSETMKEFLAALNSLAKECSFEGVTAVQHREQFIRDAFISGLRTTSTKQKILESGKLELEDIISIAQVYEDALENVADFSTNKTVACPIAEDNSVVNAAIKNTQSQEYHRSKQGSCGWCGHRGRHPKEQCPARDSQCGKCGRTGHWAKVCMTSRGGSNRDSAKGPSAVILPILASINPVPHCLERSTIQVGLGGRTVAALRDTGSGGDYIHPAVVEKCRLKIYPEEGSLSMANTTQISRTSGYVTVTLQIYDARGTIAANQTAVGKFTSRSTKYKHLFRREER